MTKDKILDPNTAYGRWAVRHLERPHKHILDKAQDMLMSGLILTPYIAVVAALRAEFVRLPDARGIYAAEAFKLVAGRYRNQLSLHVEQRGRGAQLRSDSEGGNSMSARRRKWTEIRQFWLSCLAAGATKEGGQ